MTYILHRSLNTALPTVVGAEDNHLIDDAGRRYLNVCGGVAVSCLGHDNAKVRAAIAAQLDKVAFAHTSFFTNAPAEALAEFLVKRAPQGYFKRIRKICDAYGVLLIADEVMRGMGRTGTLFALEQEGIAADITTLAKGLGAGYQPIAAVMAAEKLVRAVLVD